MSAVSAEDESGEGTLREEGACVGMKVNGITGSRRLRVELRQAVKPGPASRPKGMIPALVTVAVASENAVG